MNKEISIDSQAQAHRFLLESHRNGTTFTRHVFLNATGWQKETFDTYWSKRFNSIVESAGDSLYRVTTAFEKYIDLAAFRRFMSQAKRGRSIYRLTEYPIVLTYEFYLPLAHEGTLRRTLDTLFYEDRVMPRLQDIGEEKLDRLFPSDMLIGDDSASERARAFVNEKFCGYSMYHVSGRFRGDDLTPHSEAAAASAEGGEPYLMDETTAVVRFIFPCSSESEAEATRILFQALFVRPIIELIQGEAQIWMVESSGSNRAYVWKNTQD